MGINIQFFPAIDRLEQQGRLAFGLSGFAGRIPVEAVMAGEGATKVGDEMDVNRDMIEEEN